jgi:hypothetical protein
VELTCVSAASVRRMDAPNFIEIPNPPGSSALELMRRIVDRRSKLFRRFFPFWSNW